MSDPLLSALLELANQHGFPRSREALLAGIPLEQGKLTPALALRALQRSGIEARIEEPQLNDIPSNQLPALLLLQERKSALLLGIKNNTARILDENRQVQSIELNTLQQQYNGQVLLVDGAISSEASGNSNWFW